MGGWRRESARPDERGCLVGAFAAFVGGNTVMAPRTTASQAVRRPTAAP